MKKLERDSRNSQKPGNAQTSRTESHNKVADPSSDEIETSLSLKTNRACGSVMRRKRPTVLRR